MVTHTERHESRKEPISGAGHWLLEPCAVGHAPAENKSLSVTTLRGKRVFQWPGCGGRSQTPSGILPVAH